MKNELGGMIMTEFAGLIFGKSKTYSYLIDDGTCDKRCIRNKKCIM